MKSFLYLLIIVATVTVSCQGYSFTIPARNMGTAGVCFYNGMTLQPGDNNLPSACQNMHCNEDGSILVQGCGHFDMRDCRVLDPINLHKPYPDCCKMNFLCTMKNGELVNREISPLETGIYA